MAQLPFRRARTEESANARWQIAHPPQGLIDVFAEDPGLPPEWNLDFVTALTRVLTATCVGVVSESIERNRA